METYRRRATGRSLSRTARHLEDQSRDDVSLHRVDRGRTTLLVKHLPRVRSEMCANAIVAHGNV